jgi:hypothetical protein
MDPNQTQEHAPEAREETRVVASSEITTATKMWMVVAALLFVVILVMTYLLFTIPSAQTGTIATSTPETPVVAEPEPIEKEPTVTQPLSKRVQVTAPLPNTTVGSSFQVAGKAPGNWFFEADFPLQVRDKDGNVIARTYASAQGDWMTTELVPFTSTIHIDTVYKGEATLILLRNNPSGLPEHDDAVEVPIIIQ